MSRMNRTVQILGSGLAALYCLAAVDGSASAQQKAPATRETPRTQPAQASPAPPAADADMTTAVYGDWVLRCQRVPDDPKLGRACEVIHQVVVEGQQGPILQLAIGKPQAEQQRSVVVVLPTNVLLSRAPEIAASNQAAVLSATWRRCIPGACFAEAEFADKLAAQEQGGVVRFTDASNRPIEVPFSTRGLKLALEALGRT